MKKKFLRYAVIGAIAIVGTIGYNISMNQGKVTLSFTMRNIQALAGGESEDEGVIIGNCRNTSDEACMVTCPKCYLDYVATSGKNGPAENVRGKCQANSGCDHVFE